MDAVLSVEVSLSVHLKLSPTVVFQSYIYMSRSLQLLGLNVLGLWGVSNLGDEVQVSGVSALLAREVNLGGVLHIQCFFLFEQVLRRLSITSNLKCQSLELKSSSDLNRLLRVENKA